MSKESALAHAQSALSGTQPSPQATAAPVGALATPAQPAAPAAASTVPASLAKKEAEIVKRQLELKRQQTDIEAKQKRSDEILKVAEEFNTLRTSDPIAALRKLGFTEAEIFNYLASEQKKEPTPEEKVAAAADAAVQAKIDAFEKAQAEKEAQSAAQRDQKTLQAFKAEISSVISTNSEKFEYCAFEGPAAEALIYETVLQSVAESGGKEAISAQEAAELVENYYEERDKGMAALKKRQPVAAPAEEQPKGPTRTRTVDHNSPGVVAAKANIQRTRTLSNAATATVASTTTKRAESLGEKRARLESWLRDGVNPGKR